MRRQTTNFESIEYQSLRYILKTDFPNFLREPYFPEHYSCVENGLWCSIFWKYHPSKPKYILKSQAVILGVSLKDSNAP
jgi:hypothetical protein